MTWVLISCSGKAEKAMALNWDLISRVTEFLRMSNSQPRKVYYAKVRGHTHKTETSGPISLVVLDF